MTRTYTETEAIEAIQELTGARLVSFVQARIVQPLASPEGPRFREADLARLQLLCDLCESFEMPEETLALVMSLIDQLNTARGDLRALMQAVAAEPDEVRTRIHASVRRVRIVTPD